MDGFVRYYLRTGVLDIDGVYRYQEWDIRVILILILILILGIGSEYHKRAFLEVSLLDQKKEEYEEE
jgi:hypothetical protein